MTDGCGIWQDSGMKPRRPTIKDSTSNIHSKRRAEQVAARAARKADAKKTKLSGPHLIDYQDARRCSVCKMPFPADAKPSQEEAFTEHVRKAHRPGQTSEDFSQAALRVVREATEDK
jgi:hypothetical protein